MPLLEDGDEPNGATASQTPLQLESIRSTGALAEAEAKLAGSGAVAAAVRTTFA